MNKQDPIVVAIALSLYSYNVSASERARKLYEHFDGACMAIDDMADIFIKLGAYAATELPYPTARVYVEHALEKYGLESSRRVATEEAGIF